MSCEGEYAKAKGVLETSSRAWEGGSASGVRLSGRSSNPGRFFDRPGHSAQRHSWTSEPGRCFGHKMVPWPSSRPLLLPGSTMGSGRCTHQVDLSSGAPLRATGPRCSPQVSQSVTQFTASSTLQPFTHLTLELFSVQTPRRTPLQAPSSRHLAEW